MDSFMRFQLCSSSGLASSSKETLPWTGFGIPPSVLFLDVLIKNEIQRITKVAEDIKRKKEEFSKKYLTMNREIEIQMEKFYRHANWRRHVLKTQLQKNTKAEVSRWDRQLKICEEAEDWLKNVKVDASSCCQSLQETSYMYASDIGFINSPEIVFESRKPSAEDCFDNTRRESAAQKIEPKFCIGNNGAGQFNRPWGVCTDKAGRILVADYGNNRVQVFDESGRFLLQFGRFGISPGEFNKPVGITVDKKFRIIVADGNNHRVQVFTFTGGFIFMFGRKGFYPGQFQYPWDVDTNSEGDIAVSDTDNHRVQLFSKNGIFVTEFRLQKCTGELIQLVSPIGVAFKPDGTLLVTDNHRRILKIDERFLTAAEIKCFIPVRKPHGIACDGRGMFMVADGQENRVQVFDDQEKVNMVFGVKGSHPGEFDDLQGVCFHPNGNIIVTDRGNNRIQVF